jgi:hypothetical protein
MPDSYQYRTGARYFQPTTRFLIVFCLLYAFSLAGAASNTWKLDTETGDNIIIYTRSVPESGIREIKATCRISACPLNVYRAAMDRSTYENISRYIEVNEIMPSPRPEEWYNYQRLNFPVISKRDYTLRYNAVEDHGKSTFRIVWEIANEKGPPPMEGVVRIKICYGSMSIEPGEKEGTAQITYLLYTDPAGSIPAWIVNIANRKSIPKMLRAIRDQSIDRQRHGSG